MGLFSTEKIVTVSTAAMHLVGSADVANTDAVLTAILKNERVSETLLKSMLNGMGIKMRAAHAYAKAEYTLGFPEGKTSSITSLNNEDVADIIELDLSLPVDVNVSGYTHKDLTPFIAIQPYLLDTREYDNSTQRVMVFPPGIIWTPIEGEDVATLPKRVVVDNVALTTNELNAIITYNLWVSRYIITGSGERSIERKWVLEDHTHNETVAIPDASNITWGEVCLSAFYRKYDALGTTLLDKDYSWVYRISTNLYPELAPVVTPELDEFFPVIPLRYNNQDLTAPELAEDPLYLTSLEFLKKLKIDFVNLGVELNKNPDIDEIDSAYVMFGIDLQTNVNASLLYLNNFFHNLYITQLRDEQDFNNSLEIPHALKQPQNIVVAGEFGGFVEYGLDLDIDFDYITSSTVVGTVGSGVIGTTTKATHPRDFFINTGPGLVYENEYDDVGTWSDNTYISQSRNDLVLSTQLPGGMKRIVIVYGLEIRNKIYDGESMHTSMMDVVLDPDEHNLIIPLQFNLADSMSLVDRNSLYNDSMLLVINSWNVQKVKWYQKAWFQVVLMIVAVVITMYTGQAWLVGLTNAMTTGVMVTVMYVLPSLLIAMALDTVMDWIVTQYGEDLGIVGAIVLTIIAAVVTKGFGTFGKSAQTLMTVANYILQTASALVSSVNEFLVEAAESIVNEYADFTEVLSERYEELKGVQDILNPEWKADLNPLMFARSSRLMIVQNETPTAFYSRCLGLADNTMFATSKEIPTFVDSRLALKRQIENIALA